MIQVGVSDDIVIHVAQGNGAIQTLVAIEAVTIEGVRTRQAVHIVIVQVGLIKAHCITCAQRETGVLAVRHARALPHNNGGLVIVGIDIDPVTAGLVDGERQCRRVHFKNLARVQAPHTQVQGALGQLDLRNLVVQIQDFHAGFRPQTHRCVANLEFGAGIAIGPDAITADQRAVASDTDPLVFTRG